ncbi:hypothetical protein AOA01_00295 [Listeria monocytogenes]|uniref:hypothetical protein n=1 Tax=Listeria monocytogenes TaxID=1639 RepID=UPI0007757585|nr:hypothetical protein [Listeria monocytogenes]EAF5877618.1 hypothetical protein [Listeria monocytogenes]EKZ4877796.1 hypothetical protein [Listeria monocytogenes]KXS65756.1 hypothetical protein AWJ02_01495 [Listeria monocytogenes]KXW92911.1 hypothetical protein AWJ00_08250 [Listeria monocytogenes]
MAIELTKQYAEKIDDAFELGAVTDPFINTDYEWTGVKTIVVTSTNTVEMNDYILTGTSRYGNPAEATGAQQEMTVKKDRSFTFTVDKMTEDESKLKASKILARQIAEVVVPEVDQYRFAEMVKKSTSITTNYGDGAYKAVVKATEKLDDANVPVGGRVIAVTAAFYANLKLDPSFNGLADLAQADIKYKGQVGMVDGNSVVRVPTSYFPAGIHFIIAHSSATVAPIKLADYKIHLDAPGVSGSLVEGRVYYDAFVLNKKAKAIVSYKPTGVLVD